MGRFEEWVIRRSAALIPIFAIVVALLTVATIWLALSEVDVHKRLGPVGVVGPCREFGPNDPECRRQARLIVTACIRHELHPACVLLREELRRARRSGNERLSPRTPEGGGSSSGSSSPSSLAPPSPDTGGGGDIGGGGSDGGGGTEPNPPDNQPPPDHTPPVDIPPDPTPPGNPNLNDQINETLDDALDTGCQVTQPITGVCINP